MAVIALMTLQSRDAVCLAEPSRPRRARLCEKNRAPSAGGQSPTRVRQFGPQRRQGFVPARTCATGFRRRRPGFGPRLRLRPSGPHALKALIQLCRALRVTPRSRATGQTPSPRSTRMSSIIGQGKPVLIRGSSVHHRKARYWPHGTES